MTTSTPPVWSRETKVIVTVIMLAIAVILILLARSVLPLLALAAVLAYIFQPVVGWLVRHGVPRGPAAGLCILIILLLVAAASGVLVPAVIDGVRTLYDILVRLPDVLLQARNSLVASGAVIEILGVEVDVPEVVLSYEEELRQALTQLRAPAVAELVNYVIEGIRTAGGLFRTAAGIASGMVTVVFSSLLLLIYTFYLSKDAYQLRPWLSNVVLPPYREELDELLNRLGIVWRSFFRGQIVLSLTVGVVTTVAMVGVGLPGALVLGILAGLLEVLPNLGPVLALIPAVLVALIQGSTYLPLTNLQFALLVLGIYVLIQQLENNILVPRIMGYSLNLHPLIVLIGVVVGARFAGVLGAFLAAPVLATLKVLAMYALAKITDQDPFPAPLVETASLPRRSRRLARWLERQKAYLATWGQARAKAAPPKADPAVEASQPEAASEPQP
ncbi:MAG: AI-2E family transporter [Caldilineales bacterium]|nr:AI-2E family transporter [Caldilineales bacterium]MDW8317942.1 AI-2E family transporter [Anaerolineae bacterium]